MSRETENKRKEEREQVDGSAVDGSLDYEAEASTVASDLRVMLDGYTREDVVFALLRPRTEGET